MQRLALLAPILLAFCGMSGAQTPAAPAPIWELTVNSNLLLSLNAYTRNWDGEENTAVLYTAKLDAVAARQLGQRLNWRNTLRLAFGQTFDVLRDSLGDSSWIDTKKSTDLIDFESLLKITLNKTVNPYVAGRLLSQFWDIPDPEAGETSDRGVNPLEITESMGASFDKLKKPRFEWPTRLGLATRQTVDRRELDRGEHATYDGGLELVSLVNVWNTGKWLQLTSQITLYEALISSKAHDKDPLTGKTSSDWRYPDVNWENTLVVSVTKYIMLNLYGQLKYDREIDVDARLKSTVSLGVSFLFSNAAAGEN
jgi:hypothetical protein